MSTLYEHEHGKGSTYTGKIKSYSSRYIAVKTRPGGGILCNYTDGNDGENELCQAKIPEEKTSTDVFVRHDEPLLQKAEPAYEDKAEFA